MNNNSTPAKITMQLQLEKAFNMIVQVSLVAGVISAMCFMGSMSLNAQTRKKMTPAEILANIKPGQWIEIDGMIQKDQPVLAVEIEFRTGDFMDDDWKLLAKVQTVTPEKNEFQVQSMPVQITKDTEFNEGFKSLGDIKPGMLVKLEGNYLKDGIFLAREVDDKARKLKAEPEFDKMIEILGKVGQIDEVKQMVTIMGIQFQITNETKAKSLIK
jgi:hypothetical protein